MKFKSLELRQFQAHKKLLIEFAPGITTIQGPTDIGKSAIVRALRWLCQNNLSGDGFVRQGADGAEVRLNVTHQKQLWSIVRQRRGKKNLYSLETGEGSQQFVAFATDVPADIKALLQVEDINFQGQFDSPFWFSETAGEVSRQLNAVIDLSVIDTSLANIAALVRQEQSRKAVCEERLEQAEQDYEHLRPQQKRVKQFQKLARLQEQSKRTTKACGELESMLTDYYTHRDRLQKRQEQAAQLTTLATLAEDAHGAATKLIELEKLVQLGSSLRKVSAPPDFAPVEHVYNQWNEITDKYNRLFNYLNDTKRTFLQSKQEDSAVLIVETAFNSRTKGEICPLCKKPL